jgi:hypothetical protein
MFVDRIADFCTIWALRLGPQGQLHVGEYNCPRFERRPLDIKRAWPDESLPALGWGPYG